MAWIPTAYRSEVLDFFTTAGAPGVYNKAVGAGVGVQYESNGFVAGLNYVAQDGDSTESGVFSSEDRKSTRLNSSHSAKSRMPSSA